MILHLRKVGLHGGQVSDRIHYLVVEKVCDSSTDHQHSEYADLDVTLLVEVHILGIRNLSRKFTGKLVR